MSPQPRTAPLLAAPSPLLGLPYVAAQILGDLGESPTSLTERARKRIHKSLPVPVEQDILWADVAFGTRTHGVVLTNAGIFFKDGPADEDPDLDDADDESPEDAELNAGALEIVGAGYHYFRWQNFDPAFISHSDGVPTIAGEPFTDRTRFFAVVNPCVRICNRRTRMKRAGKELVSGILRPNREVCAVWCPTVRQTFEACFDAVGFWAFTDDDGLPYPVEVPADQYDALLQRVAKKAAAGWIPGLGESVGNDANLAGALVRRGAFTYTQAAHIVRATRIPQTWLDEADGEILCDASTGLSPLLNRWLAARTRRAPAAQGTETPGDASDTAASQAAQAMASGAATQGDAQKMAKANMAQALAGQASSMAGQTIGSMGARVLTSALGVTFAPFALAASLALGDVCSKRGAEAVTLVKDMFIEPRAQIFGRLFDGVYSNVVFEYALTPTEQELLGALMQQLGAGAFQQLGAVLSQSEHQEDDIRAFLEPLCEAVRHRR